MCVHHVELKVGYNKMNYDDQRIYDIDLQIVYTKLISVLRTKYVIKKQDDKIHRIIISKGISLFSYGENIEILVSDYKGSTIVDIQTKSKVFINLTSDVKKITNDIFTDLENILHN